MLLSLIVPIESQEMEDESSVFQSIVRLSLFLIISTLSDNVFCDFFSIESIKLKKYLKLKLASIFF